MRVRFLFAGEVCIFPGHGLVGFYYIVIKTLMCSGTELII